VDERVWVPPFEVRSDLRQPKKVVVSGEFGRIKIGECNQ
jgi:hypothetical protein